MIDITEAQLSGWIAGWFLPFARIGAFVMVAPLFGATFVPARIRIVLSAGIAILVAPWVAVPQDLKLMSLDGFALIGQQVLIGIALGFIAQLVFDAVGLAGQLLANSMGLSFAFNVDPLRGASTAAVGQFYVLVVTLLFLVLDGHLALLSLLVDGFRTMPISGPGLTGEGLWSVIKIGGLLFSGALQLALPGLTALMVTNIAFGLISRAAPTLNIFALGFPIMIIFGLLVLQIGLPGLQDGFTDLMTQAMNEMRALQNLNTVGGGR